MTQRLGQCRELEAGGTLPSSNSVYSDLFYDGSTMYMALSDNANLEGVYHVSFAPSTINADLAPRA